MSRQLAPFASQRRHWNLYAIGSAPFQVPLVALYEVVEPVELTFSVIVGSAVFVGMLLETSGVGFDSADALPSAFVAVTTTRSVLPTSAVPGTYTLAVAPAMFWQLAPFV